MLRFLLLLNLLMVLQASALILATAFPVTSSSPFDKGFKPENIEIKGYLFQDGFASEADDAYQYVLQKIEDGAKKLCANVVMEFTWKSYRLQSSRTTIQGAGTAVCDKRQLISNQTECSCS